MEKNISIEPNQKSMLLAIRSKNFPGAEFVCTIPEGIGSTGMDTSTGFTVWGTHAEFLMRPTWEKSEDAGWMYEWEKKGHLKFSVHACAEEDYIDVKIRLKNLSNVQWSNSQSFSCFNPAKAPAFADFEGTRTFLLFENKWKSIVEIERKDSPRPTIQLWYLNGGPHRLGFVEAFKAAPAIYPEGVLAVRSRCGKHLIAVTADKPLFLFSNLEFSCIHCCPTFGNLKPAEEGEAFHRIFICKDTTFDQLVPKLIAGGVWNKQAGTRSSSLISRCRRRNNRLKNSENNQREFG